MSILNGETYTWSTLSILIVAAVIQGEFYERRFGGGPKTSRHASWALPQGIIRGTLTAAYLLDLLVMGQPSILGSIAVTGHIHRMVRLRSVSELFGKRRLLPTSIWHLWNPFSYPLMKNSHSIIILQSFPSVFQFLLLIVILTVIWSFSIDTLLSAIIQQIDPCENACMNVFKAEWDWSEMVECWSIRNHK